MSSKLSCKSECSIPGGYSLSGSSSPLWANDACIGLNVFADRAFRLLIFHATPCRLVIACESRRPARCDAGLLSRKKISMAKSLVAGTIDHSPIAPDGARDDMLGTQTCLRWYRPVLSDFFLSCSSPYRKWRGNRILRLMGNGATSTTNTSDSDVIRVTSQSRHDITEKHDHEDLKTSQTKAGV
jgi:hypothetical protein